MGLLRNILYYFSVYRKHVGNRLYVVSLLTALAAATEGLGIALLLPLITHLDMADVGSEVSGFPAVLNDLLDSFGIAGSTVGILAFIGIVFLIKGMMKFAEGAYRSYMQARLAREVRVKLFETYSTMNYRYYSGQNAGHFVNVMNVQINSLLLSFEQYQRFLAGSIMMCAYFAFAFLLSWQFAAMAMAVGVFVLFLFRRLISYVRRLSAMTVSESGVLNHFLVQTMQAFKYLSATSQLSPLRKAVIFSIERLTGHQRKQHVAAAFTESIREPIAVTVLVLIIVVQVAILNAALAPILVALLFTYRAMGQVMGVQHTWQKAMNNIGSLELIERELDEAARHRQTSGARTLPLLSDGIELRNVHFAYGPGQSDVLKDISLTIPANRTIAIVGESGAGKSTLVDLLTLLHTPTSGEILVDGVRHNDVDLQSWRRQIGYVSQETVVFDDTVANNIAMWRDDYKEDPGVRERIELAAERAHARDMIAALPEGLDSVVGDRGLRLSGGQRQRLFIARELYRDPRLLILDEATSALDSESELVIKESVDELKGSTTVVIIAHRLSTIRNADYVYVLDGGRIVEEGTYDRLVGNLEGRFNRMVSLQSL